MTDGRCRFGPRAKREMITALEAGHSARAVARTMGCSPTTVTATRARWQAASDHERADGRWCAPRRPVPRSCPWALPPEAERAILDARARTNWGPMRLAWLVGRHRSSCWKVLARHGVSRQRHSSRPASRRRYEWTQAGALLHVDAFELPKFARPGHWAHGDRAQRNRTRRAGIIKVIAVVDDHTRLAYCEIHSAETAISTCAAVRRALEWFTEEGCGPAQAVMTDNHKAYGSHLFQALLADHGIRHILTPPYTPRWNGKVERFFRTLDTEWAHACVWPDSATRDRALSSFLRFYNRQRPHSAAGGRAPITRVQHVREHHS